MLRERGRARGRKGERRASAYVLQCAHCMQWQDCPSFLRVVFDKMMSCLGTFTYLFLMVPVDSPELLMVDSLGWKGRCHWEAISLLS